jgi:hypothetical protein
MIREFIQFLLDVIQFCLNGAEKIDHVRGAKVVPLDVGNLALGFFQRFKKFIQFRIHGTVPFWARKDQSCNPRAGRARNRVPVFSYQ